MKVWEQNSKRRLRNKCARTTDSTSFSSLLDRQEANTRRAKQSDNCKSFATRVIVLVLCLKVVLPEKDRFSTFALGLAFDPTKCKGLGALKCDGAATVMKTKCLIWKLPPSFPLLFFTFGVFAGPRREKWISYVQSIIKVCQAVINESWPLRWRWQLNIDKISWHVLGTSTCTNGCFSPRFQMATGLFELDTCLVKRRIGTVCRRHIYD